MMHLEERERKRCNLVLKAWHPSTSCPAWSHKIMKLHPPSRSLLKWTTRCKGGFPEKQRLLKLITLRRGRGWKSLLTWSVATRLEHLSRSDQLDARRTPKPRDAHGASRRDARQPSAKTLPATTQRIATRTRPLRHCHIPPCERISVSMSYH